jgi:hypothetical protein
MSIGRLSENIWMGHHAHCFIITDADVARKVVVDDDQPI